MATTTNYGWTTPNDTDLVKDGAAAIRTLGSSIDTTVFNNAGASIAKSIVDAKGDIIAATGADTVSRLAVGSNNQVLTADSTAATGLKWAAANAAKSFSLLSTTALTGTTVTVSGLSGYDDFLVLVQNATLAVGNVDLRWRFNGNSGSVYSQAGSNLLAAAAYAVTNSGATTGFATSICEVGTANSTNGGSVVASLSIRGANSSGIKVLSGDSGNIDNGGNGSRNRSWQGVFNDTNVISSISIITLLSSFSAGTIYVYGAA
jgi:hypothetical protein